MRPATFKIPWPSLFGFTTPFCPCKLPKLRQPLHLTSPCRYDIGVLLIAPITIPSVDIYLVTSLTLGNTRHMAVPKMGCWKLSALQLPPNWKHTPGSGKGRVKRCKPCSWETTEMPSCIHRKKIWDPRWSIQPIADRLTQSISGNVACIYSSSEYAKHGFFLSINLWHKVCFSSFYFSGSAESTVIAKYFFWEWCHFWMKS